MKRKRPTAAHAAYSHMGLSRDPFTTMALPEGRLADFVGRGIQADRLAAALFALHNVAVAGEPGSGKSSLLQLVRSRIPKDFHVVSIGVPVDDPAYLLQELLQELTSVLPSPRTLRVSGKRPKGDASALKFSALTQVKRLVAEARKPVLMFVDDLEKIQGDRVAHLTRSERTLQVLERLKGLFEMPNAALALSLQDEFHAKVREVVKAGADPTVLGLFKTVVRVEPLAPPELRQVVERRLQGAGWKKRTDEFFDPETLNLAVALSHGNPRRLMFLLSEALDRAFLRRGPRVEYQDLFEAMNEHLDLDQVCKKLLFFLAKSGRAMASNLDLQAFMGLDSVSLNRRFEILVKTRLAERANVSDGSFVYALPGLAQGVEDAPPPSGRSLTRVEKFKDEKMWVLDPDATE